MVWSVEYSPAGAGFASDGNATLGDAARSFVLAMIEGDAEALDRVSKGQATGFPSRYLINTLSENYANRNMSDLEFQVYEEENRVHVSSRDGKLDEDLKFKRIRDRFFFLYYNR